MVPFKNLSKKQRESTPYPLALELVNKIKKLFNINTVSVLWVRRDSVYKIISGTDCWDVDRDANKYEGSNPIIGHPPCGPWGKLRHVCNESQLHGIKAMDFVHNYGGVVEQPVGSQLFKKYGKTWLGSIETIDQYDYGCLCKKPTMLYWVIK